MLKQERTKGKPKVTQYDSKENKIVLRTYNTQMDFAAEDLLPELSEAEISLNDDYLYF